MGDLATLDEPVDAIVSSDDNYLTHGGGVSAALWAAAGSGLAEDPVVASLRERGQGRLITTSPSPTLGDVIVTGSGRLRADYLLHAITIDFDRGLRAEPQHLVTLFGRCLDTALDLGCASIALPLLGTGAAGAETARALDALRQSLHGRRCDPRGLAVTLVVIDEDLVDHDEDEPSEPSWFDMAASLADAIDPHLERAFTLVRSDWSPGPSSLESALLLFDRADEALVHAPGHPVLAAAMEERDRLVRSGASATMVGAAASRPFVHAVVKALTTGPAEEGLIGLPLGMPLVMAVTSLPLSLDLEQTSEAVEPDDPADGAMAHPALPPAQLGPSTGTSAVRRLRDLLLSQLPEDALDDLDQQLQEEGYVGALRERLLEHCAREDPESIIRDLFRRPELRRVAASLGYAEPASEQSALIGQILSALGFPLRGGVRSLNDILGSTRTLRTRVRVDDPAELESRMTAIGKAIEGLLRLQLHFVSMAAFGQSPEQWARERGYVRDFRQYERATMGTVAELLAHAQRDLDDAETAQARDLRRIIGKTKLAPESLHRIISLRNKAIHRERSAVEVRAAAEEFCDEVERQVVQWQRRDGGFPTQAVVEEVRFDRWGRRTMVVSVDGEEMTVFTDRDLQPGQSYLMKHFTNPWSIDPVIVEGVSLPSDPDPRS